MPAPPPMGGRAARWLLLALIALSLFGSVALIISTVAAERREREQVAQTTGTLDDLRLVERLVLSAETAQRGYYITLDSRYLEPLRGSEGKARAAMRRVAARMNASATPTRTTLLAEIDAALTEKFDELDSTVALMRDRDLDDARRRILVGDGIRAMQRLTQALNRLESIEETALADRADATSAAEARLLPLLGGLLILLLLALLFGLQLLHRVARAEAEAAQASALAEARDRADLLARELNHRVKNLFAVVLAIVQMSGRDRPEAKPVLDKASERIRALLIAHDVTQGKLGRRMAEMHDLLDAVLKPYADEDTTTHIDGPQLWLSTEQATPLGLVLHECATNAVKYGCWANGGTLDIAWRMTGETVELTWRETCPSPPTPSERTGFGSMLMTSAGRQLSGSIERRFDHGGMDVTMSFPLAPQPPAGAGGG